MLQRAVIIFVIVSFVPFSNLFACPAGQSCPAGMDCVSSPSLCVADSSSSTTSTTSSSSSDPTSTKDQLGLTFTPVTGSDDVFYSTFSAGASCTVNCTFVPSTVGIKTGTMTVTGTPATATPTFSLVENTAGASLSAGGTCTFCVTFDPQNAPIPSLVTVPITR